MDDEVIALLACPECRRPLERTVAVQGVGGPGQGFLCQPCGISYPVKDGVGLLLPAKRRSADPWEETATQLTRFLESHPALGRQLLEGPSGGLSPVDRYFRGLILEERGSLAEGMALQAGALQDCYTAEWLEATRDARDWTAKRLVQAPGPVVDLASGTGTLVEAVLSQPRTRVVATDISPRVLRRQGSRWGEAHPGRLTLLAMDAGQTAFRDNCLDRVMTFEGLVNLRAPLEALVELHRILRGDCWAVMTFYAEDDAQNRERLRELGAEQIGFRSNALASFAAAGLEAAVVFERRARARPTPPGRILEGATLDALPVVETDVEICVVHARCQKTGSR